jgi:type 1 glutamine amidotransferase
MKRVIFFALLALLALPVRAGGPHRFRVLVFTKTTGFRHDSIPAGIVAVKALGQTNGFDVDASEDAAVFTADGLRPYRVLIFLSTTGDLFTDAQKDAFKAYMAHGGAFVGIHAASDTEHHWQWYKDMVGAEFKRHPAFQKAVIRVEDRKDVSTRMLPANWEREDEWYEFTSNPRPNVHVLMTVDESTYKDAQMGKDHPFAWRHTFGGGRVWYTGCGHPKSAFAEPLLLAHLLGGIKWAANVK